MSSASSRPDEAGALSLRSYYVHLTEGPTAGGHLITDATDSFEAAILFAERWGPPGDETQEMRVQVIDGFTGEQCCFTVDLFTGQVGGC